LAGLTSFSDLTIRLCSFFSRLHKFLSFILENLFLSEKIILSNHHGALGFLQLEFLAIYSFSHCNFSISETHLELQQKNTCAHNNTHKAHANGIKKKKRTKYVSTRGMDPKFLRNQKFCKKWNNSKRPQDE